MIHDGIVKNLTCWRHFLPVLLIAFHWDLPSPDASPKFPRSPNEVKGAFKCTACFDLFLL